MIMPEVAGWVRKGLYLKDDTQMKTSARTALVVLLAAVCFPLELLRGWF